MKVENLMSADVKTCRAEETLSRAAQIMWEKDCGIVPVVTDGARVVGVLTDRDICMAAYTKGKPLSQIPISSVMSTVVYSCKSDDTIAAAEALMQLRQVRRVPVVDGENRLRGILSLNDIAREADRESAKRHPELKKDEVAQTLAAVCRPRDGHAPAVPAP
jgi:CBS domain-containing protein